MALDMAKIKFDGQGLVPAVVQDAKTNAVVMLAYISDFIVETGILPRMASRSA